MKLQEAFPLIQQGSIVKHPLIAGARLAMAREGRPAGIRETMYGQLVLLRDDGWSSYSPTTMDLLVDGWVVVNG